MYIVVNVSDELYRQVKDPSVESGYVANKCYDAIYKGIPLNKFFETYNYRDKEQEDTYKYLLHGAESLVKDNPELVRDIWNCSSCEHTKDECKDCYPELGHKNNKLKRDTEAVEKFVKSNFFKKLMESLDKQDKASAEDTEQFLKDIKAKENEK